MKFSAKVGNEPVNKWLNFGGDPDHRLDTGIVFRIRHYWEIRNVINGHSFILIRQTAALVRRALAEVCNVPVLLVYSYHVFTFLTFFFQTSIQLFKIQREAPSKKRDNEITK